MSEIQAHKMCENIRCFKVNFKKQSGKGYKQHQSESLKFRKEVIDKKVKTQAQNSV